MHVGQTLVDRFVLEELAGRGGMGEVYRALDRSTGQPVAVKILRAGAGDDAVRFEREARILADLDDPRVVRYVASGRLPAGEPYLVMEWLEGEDLAARLACERLGMTDSIKLALSVAEVLGVLHERGIIHRDLKPSNIFLVNGDIEHVKLLDFGLVWIKGATRMTRTGTMLGTISYMAPEQAKGHQDVDGRVDVFSLGCVLFECLTAEQAFSASHVAAILARILLEEAPRLGDRLPGAPAALDGLVARMLSKKPNDRPPNGRAAAEELRALLARPLPELDRVSTPAPARPPVLTDSEQRAVAVILVGAPGDASGGTLASHAPLASEAAAHGASFERFIDGSAAVMLSGPKVATDLAAQAARCALAMSRYTSGRIALAVGRSELSEQVPVGPVIDRASRWLTRPLPPVLDAQRALVMLDEGAVGLLGARFDIREDDGVRVLLGERDTAEARTLLGKPTPCVGRERELRQLAQAFDDCVEECAAQTVLVTAPPGVGKSRLAHELLRHLRERDQAVAVWIGRSDSLRAGSAFSLLGHALRDVFGVREGEPLEVRRDKVRTCVADRVAAHERQRVTEFLGEIIGTPFPDQDSLPLRAARKDAQLMSEQTRAAFVDFLAAASAREPVLFVLEDLHWGDRPTVQFLDHALRELHDRRVFVLALARPEVHEVFPRLWAERRFMELRLMQLGRKAIDRLARHVLGDEAGAETIERLARLSDGNAFYLEELLRATVEARGADLPETVVAMVQSRLAALDGESRRLLRAASVFGEVSWTGGITALLGVDRSTPVRTLLAQLIERELLVKQTHSRFPGEDEHAFRHALLREGAYSMLTGEDRVLGHRLAGEWLEAHGEHDALVLAEHFEKGGDGERAGRHYLRAAMQVHSANDTAAALAYARRGLACGVSGALRLELLGVLCESQYFQADIGATALPQAEELVQVARPGSAPWGQGMFIVLACAAQAGRFDDFKAALRSFLEVEPSLDTVGPLCLAVAAGVNLLDHFGQIDEANAALERLTTVAHALGERGILASYFWHASSGIRAACVKEDPAAGLAHSEAATTIAEAINHRRYWAIAHLFASMNRWLLGASAEAERDLQEAHVPDVELGIASAVRSFSLAWLLADREALDEARQRATQIVAAGQARRLLLDEGRGRWVLAEVLRRAGELDAAEAEGQAALSILEVACPLDVPGALATLAALRLAQGRPAEALAAAEDGLARYQAQRACSLFFRGSFLRLVRAECLAAAGHHDAALDAIAAARRHVCAVADKIGDSGYHRSFLEQVPENRRTLALARQWLVERGEGP
jgi:PAS domain-containing protein